ncbi:MAG: 4Fe-4S binding protein [Anaerolineae bacterium]
MAERDPYRMLAQRLDQTPNGYPATASGVELRILAHLFAPEEAELASALTLTPEPAKAIAERLGRDAAEVYRLLRGMAKRGLITVARQPGELVFALMPFVVGFYEMQAGRIDAALAALVEEYFQEAFPQLLAVEPALHRVIPVAEAVPAGVEIMPYECASALLDGAAAWGVVDCICRAQQRLLGKGCTAPMDVCLVMSATPGAFDRSPGIRALSREGAMGALRRAEEAGLVHSTSNTRGDIWYVCNCCTCCCGILRGIAEFGLQQSIARSAFCMQVDQAACTACESCLERCHFGALTVHDVARVDAARCIGCGLCASVCPSKALSLERRPDAPDVPEDMRAWRQARAQARGVDLSQIG